MCIMVNDMFSVDKDWVTHAGQDKPGLPMSSVFVIMRLHGVSVAAAKDILKQRYLEMEQNFLDLSKRLVEEVNSSPQIARYLMGLHYAITGNAMWHLHNTRYEADPNSPFRVDPNHTIASLPRKNRKSKSANKNGNELSSGDIAFVENEELPGEYIHILLLQLYTADAKKILAHLSTEDDVLGLGQAQSVSDTPAWLSTYPQLSDEVLPPNRIINSLLTTLQHILEPFNYITTLPSKGIRRIAIDALDIWYRVPENSLNSIKKLIDMLHSSSLM
jgi:ophiobolin F synthase